MTQTSNTKKSDSTPASDLKKSFPRKMANLGQVERFGSLAAGSLLLWQGSRVKNGSRLPLLAGGTALVVRGVTRRSLVYRLLGINRSGQDSAVRVERTGTIDRSPEELYSYWRDFSNLPGFMHHLESVQVLDNKRSKWIAKAPLDAKVEWEAEIVEDKENEVLAWRSLPGAQVENSGRVTFKPASKERGTEVKIVLDYKPPAGSLGVALARFTGEEPGEQVREDLRHFKMLMESGQVISTQGQPSGRKK